MFNIGTTELILVLIIFALFIVPGLIIIGYILFKHKSAQK